MKAHTKSGLRLAPKMRQNLTWLYITAGFAFAGFAGFALFIYLNVGQYDDATAAPVTVSTTDKYLFSASTGTYSEITGGTLISNNSGLSTQVFNNQNIGFISVIALKGALFFVGGC